MVFNVIGLVLMVGGLGVQTVYGQKHLNEIAIQIDEAHELYDEWQEKYGALNSAYISLEAGIDAYTSDLVQYAVTLRLESEQELQGENRAARNINII